MKKFLTRILGIALIVLSVFSLTACEVKLKAVNITTDGVLSNGGPVAKQGNTLYFVNGYNKASATSNTFGKVDISSLYKVVLNENGEISYDENGAMQNVEQVVSSQVGFEKGSIYVFGDYIYYATPYSGKDKTGSVLYSYLSFYRIKNDGSERSIICTTETKDTKMYYSYYVIDEKTLALVVFEQDTGNLTSYVMADGKVKVLNIDTKVSSCVFSENNGLGSDIDKYVYYTKAVESTDEIQQGNKVYKFVPNSTETTLISTGRNIDIVTIVNGYLVYSADDTTYINNHTDANLSTDDHIISYVKYDTVLYVPVENGVSMIVVDKVADDNTKVKYINGNNVHDNYTICSTEATFVGVNGDDLIYYGSDNMLYKVNYKSASNTAVKICTKEVAKQDGPMVVEIVDGYVYFFGTIVEDEVTYTMLYRAKIAVETAQAAELVGKR